MFQLVFALFVSLAIAVSYVSFVVARQAQKICGTVIILNGPSVAGKSSIQREFQKLMLPALWVRVGIDQLFDQALPEGSVEGVYDEHAPNPIRWVEFTCDESGAPLISLRVGPEGDTVAFAMNSAIASYAQSGCNVIVDYIAYKKEWLDDLRLKLHDVKTHWVKVNLPLAVLEAREAARGTSPLGHARSHYNYIHWDVVYDFVVDSSADNQATIAQKIKLDFNL